MAEPKPDVKIVDRPDALRYEAFIGEELVGFVEYRLAGRRTILLHTEVPPAFEGRGIAGAMARHILDEARASTRRVTAKCPFIRSWLTRHPEYDDIVTALPEDRRAG